MKHDNAVEVPRVIAQMFDRARASYRSGDFASAAARCDEILKATPGHFGAWHLKGVIAYQHHQLSSAEKFVQRALAIDPEHPEALTNLGAILLGLNKWADAVSSFDRVLLVRPKSPQALINRGMALLKLMRFEGALENFDAALAIAGDANAFYGRGNALLKLRRLEEAVASFDRALAIQPGIAEAMTNRASALFDLLRHEEAIECCERSLAVNPIQAEALNTRGSALMELGRMNEALESLTGALAIRPDFASARFNRGLCNLASGNFGQGWEDYEWRTLSAGPTAATVREFSGQRWPEAETLRGKSVLLQAEQGLGDTIQFCRYAPMLVAQGAHVVLEVQPSLKSLLSRLDGVETVIAQGEPIPSVDFCCPLLSLPLSFQTTPETIPAHIPYINAMPGQVTAWRNRLANMARPLIGIAWSGNPTHRNDRNRSAPLEQLARHLNLKGTLVSLQKDCGIEDGEWIRSHRRIHHFGDELLSFEDTAALVSLMDVVISVDTSIAHLAGALGQNVFVLLPLIGTDWRWLQHRSDSPWYPTAHLVRQTAKGDWTRAMGYVVDALRRQGLY